MAEPADDRRRHRAFLVEHEARVMLLARH